MIILAILLFLEKKVSDNEKKKRTKGESIKPIFRIKAIVWKRLFDNDISLNDI